MKTPDLIDLAARNLRESVLRNGLTTLGIAVGVASLVAMLSLGAGLQRLATQRLSRSGLFDTVIIFSSQGQRRPGRFERNNNADSKPPESRPLDENARAELARQPHVIEVYPDIRFMAEASYGGRTRPATVASLPPSSRASEAFDEMQGQFFSGPAAEEVILHTDFARELDDHPEKLLGQPLKLRYASRQPIAGTPGTATKSEGGAPGPKLGGFSVLPQERELRVVGIVENEPNSAFRGPARSGLLIPVETAEGFHAIQFSNFTDVVRASATAPSYQSLFARVTDPKYVTVLQDAAKRMGFRTFSFLDATQNLRRLFAVLDLFLGIFGSLALAVASLGIINTLIMAILERRREIGIMKALGASDGDVQRLFFAEAAVMGLVGGVFGVAIGWSIGRIINFGTNLYLKQQELPPENIWFVPWWLVAGAIGFAIVVSLASGLYPAARAARLDPVQALRYE